MVFNPESPEADAGETVPAELSDELATDEIAADPDSGGQGSSRHRSRRVLLVAAVLAVVLCAGETARVVHAGARAQNAFLLATLCPDGDGPNRTRLAKLAASNSLLDHPDSAKRADGVTGDDLSQSVPALSDIPVSAPLQYACKFRGLKLGLAKATVRFRIDKANWSPDGHYDSVVVLVREGLSWKADLAETANRTIEAQAAAAEKEEASDKP